MAKWLNKYFSLGNSKTKSPPQPPRPDYREQRRRGERPSQPPQAVPQAPSATSASCGTAAASCFSASSGSLPDDSGSTSDLIRAYRAQKERDFEDPYNGPGSSLRKLRAMCRLDYCGGGEPGGGQRAFSASSASGAPGCCCASSGVGAAASSSSSSGSPHLYRSSSERRPATPAEVRYISPKHRLIKVESAAGGAAEHPGGSCSGGRTWSPTACGGKKLLNKCGASAAEESGAGKKDKTRAEVGLVLKKLRNFSPSKQTLCVEESLNLLDMKPPEEAEIASDGSQRSLNEEFGSKKSVDEEVWECGEGAPGSLHCLMGAVNTFRTTLVLIPSKVTIADDYSDPFDAKNDLKSKAGKGESAGYMEPYEAQRIMTEFQRDIKRSEGTETDGNACPKADSGQLAAKFLASSAHPPVRLLCGQSVEAAGDTTHPEQVFEPTEFQRQESVRSQHKSIQLYDTPYEPEGPSMDSDSESTVSPRLRESKLPQDDDRPADEYDQPWEWNRVTIPALAAQFNGSEKRQSSPSPSRDRRRQLRAPGGGFKPIKHGSPEFCGILGERVDPAVPLEKQIWYHGAISRGDAENLLRLCKECSYLVRNSQTSRHDYSLSLKSNQGFMHMKLAKTKEKYVLGQNSPPFDSVPEVIHYYTTRKLPIKGAEHLSLLYPVAVRTL
eukprot:bmy_02839T0